MKWLFGLAVLTAVVVLYVMVIRPWLREQSWAKPFFAWVDPIELALWKKSETILFARFKIVTGVLLTTLTSVGAIDITPLMPFVPDAWEPAVRILWNLLPLTITAIGWVDERLRKDTTKPLEVVALPENKPPEVAAAVAKIEAADAQAKAVIEVAKAEGAV